MLFRFVTPLIVSPLLLRFGGADALGAYSIIFEIIGYIILLDLGIGLGFARHVAQLGAGRDTTEELSRTAVTSVRFLAFVGLVATVLTTIVAMTVRYWMNAPEHTIAETRTALMILAAWMAVRFPLSMFQLMLYARQQIARYGISEVVGEVARTVVSIAVVAWGFGVPGLAFATVIAQASTYMLCVWWLRDEIRALDWKMPASREMFRDLMTVSYPIAVMSLSDRLSFFTQNAIVGYLFDTSVAAAFYATRMPGFYAGSVLWRLADTVFPGINELYGAKQWDRLLSVYVRLTGYALGAALWLGAGVWAFNRDLISVWVGPALFLGRSATIATAALVFIATWKYIAAKFIIAEGRTRMYMLLGLVEGGVAIGLSFLLGRLWNPAGVMWGTVFASVITIGYLVAVPARRMGASAAATYVRIGGVAARAAAVGVAACIVVTLLRAQGAMPLPWPVALAVVLAVGALGFAAIGLQTGDRAALLRLVAMRRATS